MGLLSRPFSFAQALAEYVCSPTSPPPSLCRRGCTVPGEGWSPAETEHSGEAPRRRRSPLWRRVRSASPLAAAWIGTRITRGGRRGSRHVTRSATPVEVVQRGAPHADDALPESSRSRRHDADDDRAGHADHGDAFDDTDRDGDPQADAGGRTSSRHDDHRGAQGDGGDTGRRAEANDQCR
jgi:hypothetical protein